MQIRAGSHAAQQKPPIEIPTAEKISENTRLAA